GTAPRPGARCNVLRESPGREGRIARRRAGRGCRGGKPTIGHGAPGARPRNTSCLPVGLSTSHVRAELLPASTELSRFSAKGVRWDGFSPPLGGEKNRVRSLTAGRCRGGGGTGRGR